MFQEIVPSLKRFGIALLVFFAVIFIFFYPEFQGKTLFQSDISQWEAMHHEIDVFKKYNLSPEEVEMVLVACHGPFTWGKDAAKAVYNAAVLEELAKMAYLTLQINPATPPIKQTLTDKHYLRKHGRNAYYGQDGY